MAPSAKKVGGESLLIKLREFVNGFILKIRYLQRITIFELRSAILLVDCFV